MHRHLEFPKSKIKKHVLKNANSLLKTSNTIEFGVTEKNILKNQTDNFLVEELKSLGGVKEKQL